MTSLKIWLKALRAPFFTATVIPVLIGTAMAWHAGFFSFSLFILILVASICVHAGLNLANDYFDHKSGNDEANTTPTPFSGGSRVIQDKLLSPKQVLTASLLFFTVSIILGLYINSITNGNTFLYIGTIGIAIAFFYTAPPLKLGYNGLGEILTGFGFGTLIIAASYFVQTGTIPTNVLLASVPLSIFVALILLINEFPDYEADKKTNKRNWVVLLGKKTAKNIYILLIITAYASLLSQALILKTIPLWTLISLITIIMALGAVKTLNKHYDKIEELLPANKATIGLHLVFGILFTLGFVIDKFVS